MIASVLRLIVLLAFAGATPAAAKTWQVRMVNSGPAGLPAFVPGLLKVKAGDTVKFVAADKGHNAEAIASMIPPGASVFKGKTDEEIAVTLTAPGFYAYKCSPHYTLGMVGLIEVGAAKNRNQIVMVTEKLPGLAKKTMTGLIAQAK